VLLDGKPIARRAPATASPGYALTDDGFVELVLPDRGAAVSLVVESAR
jgi:hypothetical protein